MFMFVFAIILISLVGLFLQVVNSLALFFASHQLAMGQQIFAWHNMARDYACATGTPQSGTLGPSQAGPAGGVTDPMAAAIRQQRADYGGRYWPSVIFDGHYAGTTSTSRIVFSYVPATGSFGGFTHSDVLRQFRSSFTGNEFQYSVVYSGGTCPTAKCVDVTIASTPAPAVTTITDIPPTVPDGASGIATGVKCP